MQIPIYGPPYSNRPIGFFFSIFFGSWSLITIGIACKKLAGFIAIYGIELSPSNICLSLIILGRMLRLFYYIDPTSVYRVFPEGSTTTMITIPIPLTIIANLLTAFYWQEVISQASSGKLQVSSLITLRRWRWPCFIIILIIYALEIISSVGRALALSTYNALVYVTVIFYIVTLFCTGVFFFITGVKILHLFPRKDTQKLKRLSRVTVLMIISSFGMLLLIIAFILVAISDAPWLMLAQNWLSSFGLETTSLAEVLVFRVPSSGSPQRSSGTSGKEKNSNLPTEKTGSATTTTSTATSTNSDTVIDIKVGKANEDQELEMKQAKQ